MGVKETSKFIALILRHKPEAIGITLDEHGWADVDELIAGIGKNVPFSMVTLEEIVRDICYQNAKNYFGFAPKP